MRHDSCFELGHVRKTHGIRGEIKAFLDSDAPLKYRGLKSVYLELKNKLIPFMIEKINIQGASAIIKLQDVNSIEEAGKLVKSKLYLPLKMLNDGGTDKIFRHDLIGFTVIDGLRRKLGKITGIYEAGSNGLIAVDYKGREILIPLNNELIKKVNLARKELNMELPEGLLDL
jgi:16S rRNA processing protein RimM